MPKGKSFNSDEDVKNRSNSQKSKSGLSEAKKLRKISGGWTGYQI